MSNTAAVYLYRALLREAKRQFQRYNSTHIAVRASVNGEAGSYDPNAAVGLGRYCELHRFLASPGPACLVTYSCWETSVHNDLFS
jgi:hypothetical protein